jgi:hypothetical protein
MLVSKGAIKGNGELIAASCSSFTGMSGGPLYIVLNKKWNVVGLLIGACASMLQFPLYAILANTVHPVMSFDKLIDQLRPMIRNNDAAENHFRELIEFHESMSEKDFIEEINFMISKEIRRGFDEDGLNLDYNIFFPLWNADLRSELSSAVHNFEEKSREKKSSCSIF